MNSKLLIDSLIVIDDNGMPKPPTTRQLIDRDIRELYTRDKTPDKKIKELLFIILVTLNHLQDKQDLVIRKLLKWLLNKLVLIKNIFLIN